MEFKQSINGIFNRLLRCFAFNRTFKINWQRSTVKLKYRKRRQSYNILRYFSYLTTSDFMNFFITFLNVFFFTFPRL